MYDQPRIVKRDPFRVVGLAYTGPMKAKHEIPALWQRFNERVSAVKHREQPGVSFGVFYSTPEQFKKSEMTYLAAVAVKEPADDTPAEMVVRRVQGGRFAKITHKGPISKITETIDFLFRIWIPESDFELENRESYELYDERFRFEEADSAFDIFAAVKKK